MEKSYEIHIKVLVYHVRIMTQKLLVLEELIYISGSGCIDIMKGTQRAVAPRIS